MNNLFGWAGKAQADADYEMLQHLFSQFQIVGSVGADKKVMLYEFSRRVLGKDTSNYPQLIGDCVSFGAKNAIEYLTCTEKVLSGQNIGFHPVFPPYLYGCSRVFVGNNQIPCNSDGSSGAWAAAAVLKWGVLHSDEVGIIAYSANVAKQWGCNGPPKNFIPVAQTKLVKSAAKITSISALNAAIASGYPCTIASNQAFKMSANSKGYHDPDPTTQWPHQMCLIGIAANYAIILNSWGDVFGHLTDLDDPTVTLPVGVIRADINVVANMISSGECFAYSQYNGLPDNSAKIDEALFKLVG